MGKGRKVSYNTATHAAVLSQTVGGNTCLHPLSKISKIPQWCHYIAQFSSWLNQYHQVVKTTVGLTDKRKNK